MVIQLAHIKLESGRHDKKTIFCAADCEPPVCAITSKEWLERPSDTDDTL